MTSVIEGKRYCAEIDIAWCYPFRTIILTDDSLLGYNYGSENIEHFYLDSWNQYAKCFILRFLSGYFDSFNDRRIQEIEGYASQLVQSNKLPNVLMPDSLSWIKDCCPFNIDKLKEHRAKFKLWKYSLKYPFESIKNLWYASIFFFSRKIRMYGTLGDLKVVSNDESLTTIIEKQFDGSFITKFKFVRCNSRLQYYISYFVAYLTTPPFLLTVYVSNKKLNKNFCEIKNEFEAKQMVDDYYNSIIIDK